MISDSSQLVNRYAFEGSWGGGQVRIGAITGTMGGGGTGKQVHLGAVTGSGREGGGLENRDDQAQL